VNASKVVQSAWFVPERCAEGGTVKKKSIVIVLVLAVLLLLVMTATAYGAPAPAPMTTGITTGIVLYSQQQNAGGTLSQTWYSWVAIEGINGKPDTGSITKTLLNIGPWGKIISKVTYTEPVADVIRVSPTTMEFRVFATLDNWTDFGLKVVDGGPGVKKDAWYATEDGIIWNQLPILAGDIIVF
jgi:hypothetical protein